MIQTSFIEPPPRDHPIGAIDLWAQGRGLTRFVGIDEAGRGPLAGPVVAAAVCLPPGPMPAVLRGLNDSKQLSESRRDELFVALMNTATAVGVAVVEASVIDEINILQATLRAMHQAVGHVDATLSPSIEALFVDGNRTLSERHEEQWALVKGDRRAWCIAAASIIAKVSRDRLMLKYHERYPMYGFDKHKGYGTVAHRRALLACGPCPIHRRSFRWQPPD